MKNKQLTKARVELTIAETTFNAYPTDENRRRLEAAQEAERDALQAVTNERFDKITWRKAQERNAYRG